MSKTKSAPLIFNRITSGLACALLLLLAVTAEAQSTIVDQPTPVTSSQIAGRIAARDIGDSRLTRHFYILTGTPGDLVFKVESRNLDGDVDLFQAGTLRPLAKVSMYASELATSTTKSIYLRQRESIILRVEARTPNDNEGTYRINFSGGFEAMAAPVVQPETETTAEQTPARRDKNSRRVSSVGARIEEPEPVETAKTTQPEPSTEKPAEPSNTSDNPSTTGNTEKSTQPAATSRAQRPPTSRVGRRRRGRVRPTPPPETTAQNNSTAPEVSDAPPPVVTKPSGIEAGAKLVIETREGTRIERYMSTVRRVTVENGQIIIFTRDGKIERHLMTNVVRMAIEP